MTDHLTATPAPYGLRCERQVAPLGISTRAPLSSWRPGTTRRGDDPVSYRVVVTAVSSGGETVRDSGEVADPTAVSVRGSELAPRTGYQWQVTVTSADELANSADSSSETGHDDWTASWITPDPSEVDCQIHDVTELLQPGENFLEVTVAGGWWSGYVGFDPRRSGAHYGTFPELIAELHFDGEIIGADGTWQSRRATTRYADLLMGEGHDLRREPKLCRSAVVTGDDHTRLAPAVVPPVRVTEELPAKSVAPGENGYIVDFGQNVAGRVRLTARGLQPGDRVVVRHGEALNTDGTLHTDNLRTAEATDILVVGAEPTVTFEPRFTYHGFRYAEVTGLTGLSEKDITAVVLGSDAPPAGEFACDDPAIQRLHHNIQWGLRGNFVSIPTDCPSATVTCSSAPDWAVSTGRAHGTSRSVALPAPRGPEWTVC
jgi:hypothetical protein